ALICEVERLVGRYGPDLIRNCIGRLGPEIVDSLRSVQAQVWLESERHASAVELDRLVRQGEDHAVALARAGGAALEVFAAFLVECLSLAVVRTERMQAHA